jgi:predicted MFS family arabinose efflux permease
VQGKTVYSFDPDQPLSIFAYAYASAVGVSILMFGPLLIGAYIEIEGMSEIQAGYLFSIEMAGYAISSALVFTIITRVNWRHILLVGVLVAVLSNIISIYIHGYTELLKIRFLAGLGGGLLMNVTIVSIGLTHHIDRNYGFWAVTQLVIGAIGVFLLPDLILKFGLAAPFATVTMLALLVLPLIKRFPTQGKSSSGNANQGKKLWLGLSALFGILIYYSGQAAVWAYIERIGIDAEIPLKSVGNFLSLSLVVAIFGAALATWLGSRRGRRLPITASMICSAMGIGLLWDTPSIYPYALAACLFNAAWYFCLPYLTAVIANIDSNGRLLIGVAIVFPASLALGPALATYLLTGASYSPVLWIGMLSLPVGLIIMWKAAGEKET